jgi:hypothetical protein
MEGESTVGSTQASEVLEPRIDHPHMPVPAPPLFDQVGSFTGVFR